MRPAFLGLVLALAGAAQEEPGFEKVFNGKDWAGIKFFMGRQDADPAKTFRVEEGAIVCTGRPSGYWYTEKTHLNFTLRFDYRYPAPNPEKVNPKHKRPDGTVDETKWDGNSGYLLFIKEHKVWPRSLEIQGMNRDVLSVIPISSKARWTSDREARAKVRRPLGEWNAVEIASKDGVVKCSLNGTLVSTTTEHEFKDAGHIGFQSEAAEIHWRNVRIKRD